MLVKQMRWPADPFQILAVESDAVSVGLIITDEEGYSWRIVSSSTLLNDGKERTLRLREQGYRVWWLVPQRDE